eukprot:6182547-Pleurochrysis_carterae.AAC.1
MSKPAMFSISTPLPSSARAPRTTKRPSSRRCGCQTTSRRHAWCCRSRKSSAGATTQTHARAAARRLAAVGGGR